MQAKDRNAEIQRTIEAEKIPILPFELELARGAMEKHVKTQEALGREMGEAMNQSSETWHDNAPAEAISQASRTLAETAEQTIRVLKLSEIFEYESSPEDGVTLGSIVAVRYGSSVEQNRFFLTGISRELTPSVAAKIPNVEDIDVINISSPVGRALMGKKAGETTMFTTPNGREIELTIDSVEQLVI